MGNQAHRGRFGRHTCQVSAKHHLWCCPARVRADSAASWTCSLIERGSKISLSACNDERALGFGLRRDKKLTRTADRCTETMFQHEGWQVGSCHLFSVACKLRLP